MDYSSPDGEGTELSVVKQKCYDLSFKLVKNTLSKKPDKDALLIDKMLHVRTLDLKKAAFKEKGATHDVP